MSNRKTIKKLKSILNEEKSNSLRNSFLDNSDDDYFKNRQDSLSKFFKMNSSIPSSYEEFSDEFNKKYPLLEIENVYLKYLFLLELEKFDKTLIKEFAENDAKKEKYFVKLYRRYINSDGSVGNKLKQKLASASGFLYEDVINHILTKVSYSSLGESQIESNVCSIFLVYERLYKNIDDKTIKEIKKHIDNNDIDKAYIAANIKSFTGSDYEPIYKELESRVNSKKAALDNFMRLKPSNWKFNYDDSTTNPIYDFNILNEKGEPIVLFDIKAKEKEESEPTSKEFTEYFVSDKNRFKYISKAQYFGIINLKTKYTISSREILAEIDKIDYKFLSIKDIDNFLDSPKEGIFKKDSDKFGTILQIKEDKLEIDKFVEFNEEEIQSVKTKVNNFSNWKLSESDKIAINLTKNSDINSLISLYEELEDILEEDYSEDLRDCLFVSELQSDVQRTRLRGYKSASLVKLQQETGDEDFVDKVAELLGPDSLSKKIRLELEGEEGVKLKKDKGTSIRLSYLNNGLQCAYHYSTLNTNEEKVNFLREYKIGTHYKKDEDEYYVKEHIPEGVDVSELDKIQQKNYLNIGAEGFDINTVNTYIKSLVDIYKYFIEISPKNLNIKDIEAIQGEDSDDFQKDDIYADSLSDEETIKLLQQRFNDDDFNIDDFIDPATGHINIEDSHKRFDDTYSNLLKELKKLEPVSGSEPEEQYHNWSSAEKDFMFDKPGLTTWHKDRQRVKEYLKSMGLLK